MSDDEDFEEQLRLEQAEKEKRETLNHGRTKVDDDGTVMEWDADKGAWFPKVSVHREQHRKSICHNSSSPVGFHRFECSWWAGLPLTSLVQN